ncbi:MAG: ECF transporter S component [Ruminococcus sp.]|nr:ECF transporter S component [Ruminococcus sp.]
MNKSVLKYIFVLILIPALVIAGALFYPERSYAIVSLAVALLACVPFFISFEKTSSTRRLVMLAVMTALSVAGRFIFAPIPFFKPVTAMVVIAGMYFGAEFGFLTGALSAVISNFYFGQGAWTPFQMFSWGIIGFIAGILSSQLIRSKIILIIYGALAGVIYSLIMDIWTVLWMDGMFNPARFSAAVITALPVTLKYVISNIIFLIILAPLFGKKIERLKQKYGI